MADPYGGVQWNDWSGSLKYISNAIAGGNSGWADGLHLVGPTYLPATNPYGDTLSQEQVFDPYNPGGSAPNPLSNAVASLDRTTVGDVMSRYGSIAKSADLNITGFAQLNPALWALRTNTGVRYATNLAGWNQDGMEWNPRIEAGTQVGYIGIDNPMGINASKLALLPENYDLNKLNLQGHKPGSEDKAWMEDLMGWAILGSALFAIGGGAAGLFGGAASNVSLTGGATFGGTGLKVAAVSSLADMGAAAGAGYGLAVASSPGIAAMGGAAGITGATAAGTIGALGLTPVGAMATIGNPASFVNTGGVFPYVPDLTNFNGLVGDYTFGNIGLKDTSKIGLQSSGGVPNVPTMGGGQGITGYSPSQAGTITESGFIPDGTVPSIGDPNSFINTGRIENGPSMWDGFRAALQHVNLGLGQFDIPTTGVVIPGAFSGLPGPEVPLDQGKVTDVMGGLPWNSANQRGLGLRSRNPYKSGLAVSGL